MDKTNLLKNILLKFLYVIILIAAVALVSAAVAAISTNFTQDINAIVIACFTSVWVTVVVVLNILINIIIYRKKTKELNKDDIENYKKRINKIKNRSILTIIISSIFIGFVLYNLKNELVNSITNGAQSDTGTFNSLTFFIKIGVTVVLVVVFIIKIKNRNKTTRNENDKSSPNAVYSRDVMRNGG